MLKVQSQIIKNISRGLVGVSIVAGVSACVSNNYSRNNPDTVIYERVLEASGQHLEAQKFNFGEQKSLGAKRASIPISVEQHGVDIGAKFKEINYVQSREGFSDSNYTKQTYKSERPKYLYVDSDVAVKDLVSPLEATEDSTIKNKRLRGKPSLLWDSNNYLSLGGRLVPPSIGKSLLCDFDDRHYSACQLYSGGQVQATLRNTDFGLSYSEQLTRKVFLEGLPEIINKHKMFSLERNTLDQNANVEDLDVEIKRTPRAFIATLEKKPSQLNLNVEVTGQHRYFSRDTALSSVPQKFHYLADHWLKPQFFSVGLYSNKRNHNKRVLYYDTEKLLTEVTRLESLGHGYIRLTANMNEVDVYVDGVLRGSLKDGKPFVSKLLEGRHTIQARKDFFGSKTISVEIEADDAFAYDFDLKPSGNLSEQLGEGKIIQSTGVLVIATTRNDVKVVINGVERIPPTKMPKMPSGKHMMKVITPQRSFTLEILVKDNARTLVDLDKRLGW